MSGWLLLAFVVLPFVWIWVGAVAEVLRDRQRSAGRRAGWAAVLVFVPVFGLAAYVVMRRPPGVHVVDGARVSADAARMVDLAERRQRGDVDDEAYRREVDSIFESRASF